MRAFLAILLTSVILYQSAGKLIVLIDYSLNKTFISKNLCENKAKAKMKCNGKCHLKKQLQKEEKKEHSPSNNVKEKSEVQFFNSLRKTDLLIFTLLSNEMNVIYLDPHSDKHTATIFQPPRA